MELWFSSRRNMMRLQLILRSKEHVIKPMIPEKYTLMRKPPGRFVIGGPHGDARLTGTKIIIDTHGGWGAHGGGAFSGKDPTKVDRSGAYLISDRSSDV